MGSTSKAGLQCSLVDVPVGGSGLGENTEKGFSSSVDMIEGWRSEELRFGKNSGKNPSPAVNRCAAK